MRPAPFVLAAAVCLAAAVALSVRVPRPLEASLYAAVAAVLGGFAAGIAFGLLDPDVPDVDYTAVGSIVIALSVLALAVFAGRPMSGYVTAVLGGAGAGLVGFESGRTRAD